MATQKTLNSQSNLLFPLKKISFIEMQFKYSKIYCTNTNFHLILGIIKKKKHSSISLLQFRKLSLPETWGKPKLEIPTLMESVQFSHSVVSNSLQPHGLHAFLSITNSQSLLKLMSLKLMSIESVMPSNNLILCHPLLLLPSIFHSIRVFSSESVLCIRWPKYCSFNFSISPSKEYSGLISFRMDWLDLLAV